MRYIQFLTLEDILAVHEHMFGVHSKANEALIDGALNRVRHRHCYERIDDIKDLAAFLLLSICKAHAFPDGNKRTALMACSLFLDSNFYEIEESSDLADVIEQVAASTMTFEGFCDYLYPLIHPTEIHNDDTLQAIEILERGEGVNIKDDPELQDLVD